MIGAVLLFAAFVLGPFGFLLITGWVALWVFRAGQAVERRTHRDEFYVWRVPVALPPKPVVRARPVAAHRGGHRAPGSLAGDLAEVSPGRHTQPGKHAKGA